MEKILDREEYLRLVSQDDETLKRKISQCANEIMCDLRAFKEHVMSESDPQYMAVHNIVCCVRNVGEMRRIADIVIERESLLPPPNIVRPCFVDCLREPKSTGYLECQVDALWVDSYNRYHVACLESAGEATEDSVYTL